MAVVETSGATATAAGFGATAITLTGSFLGIPYDSLVLAFFGGLVALLHLPPAAAAVGAASWVRLAARGLQVLSSALFGGVLSPVAAAGASEWAPWAVNHSSPLLVKLACAFILGIVAQVVIPLGMDIMRGFMLRQRRKQDTEGS